MNAHRLLTTGGVPWHVFPIRCRDVARGIMPLFQDTPFRVRHWNEPRDPSSQNPGACCLLDYAENGLLVVTDEPTPPMIPAGWLCRPALLEDGWEVCTGEYKIRLTDRVATVEGDRCTFEATMTGEDR